MTDKNDQAGKGHGEGQGAGDEHGKVPFTFDKRPLKIHKSENPVSAAYLYGLGVPAGFMVMREGRGSEDDVEISREGNYEIQPGDKFYTAKEVLTPGCH